MTKNRANIYHTDNTVLQQALYAFLLINEWRLGLRALDHAALIIKDVGTLREYARIDKRFVLNILRWTDDELETIMKTPIEQVNPLFWCAFHSDLMTIRARIDEMEAATNHDEQHKSCDHMCISDQIRNTYRSYQYVFSKDGGKAFAHIFQAKRKDSEIVFDPVAGHFCVLYNGHLYDYTGCVDGLYIVRKHEFTDEAGAFQPHLHTITMWY